MKSILELPPHLDLEQLPVLLNDRIQQINDALGDCVGNPFATKEDPANLDFDLGYRRIKNLGDPKDDLDSVNLRTLRKFGGASVQVKKAAASGVDAYTIVFAKDGILVNNDQVPAYVVQALREGNPLEMAIYAKGAPSSAPISANMSINGVSLLTSNLVLPIGQKGPVYSTAFAFHKLMPKGTIVFPTIDTAGGATFVTIQLEVKRA